MTTRRPNILWICSDQHRWNALNCCGNPQVISPGFDRMAREGVRFVNAVSTAPVCAPARTTWQTGLHAHQHGVRSNQHPWVGQHFRSLADHADAAGYEACFVGKAHWGRYLFYDRRWQGGFVPPERRLRWKHWRGCEGHVQYGEVVYDDRGEILHDGRGRPEATFQTDLALDFIDRCGERPWLVHLNWGPPHNLQPGPTVRYDAAYYERGRRLNRELGFNLPDELFARQDPCLKLLLPQALLFDAVPQRLLQRYDPAALAVDPNVPPAYHALVRHLLREYYAMITGLDEELARIFAVLAATGRDRDTIVLYTSDHGDRLGAHCTLEKFRTKSSPHQNSVRVPLLAWGPGAGVGCGIENRTPCGSVDLLPTLLNCMGLPAQPQLPGRSLRPCFSDGCRNEERTVLLGLDPWRAVWDGSHLYAIHGGERDASGRDAPPAWRPIHLIDAGSDPYDLRDLAADPAQAALRGRLHDELVRQLIATSDHDFVLRSGLRKRELF